jgi:DNA-binding transcriptional LysR family regulator
MKRHPLQASAPLDGLDSTRTRHEHAMNLRFVEAFYWAVALGSVTRAAEKLFVTQSALSSRIATLETELGVLLLDRRDKQFRLTAAGTRFQRHAEKLLNLQRDIHAEFGGASERTITLRIGVIESVLHSWLIDWLQALRQNHPALELELTVETTPVLQEQMRRGTVDLILAALPAPGDAVLTRALAPMPMVFVGQRPAKAALARVSAQREWSLAELSGTHELLTFQRGSQPHVSLLELCRKAGVDAPRVHSISSISAMVQLVESGFGVATLPLAAVQRLAERRTLMGLRCAAALVPLPIHLSWRADPASSAAGSVVDSVISFSKGLENQKPARKSSSKKSMKA